MDAFWKFCKAATIYMQGDTHISHFIDASRQVKIGSLQRACPQSDKDKYEYAYDMSLRFIMRSNIY